MLSVVQHNKLLSPALTLVSTIRFLKQLNSPETSPGVRRWTQTDQIKQKLKKQSCIHLYFEGPNFGVTTEKCFIGI